MTGNPRHAAGLGRAVALALIAIAPTAASIAAEPPRPVPLRALSTGFIPQRGWQDPVCRLAGATCTDTASPPSLHRAADTPPGTYHAILPGPILAELGFGGGGWQLRRRWDFRRHPLAATSEDDRAVRLHPALYPAGPDRWAVALERVRTEGYAGGGAGFSRADFLLLPPEGGAVGPEATLFAGIPFACSKMLRACFTERDHRRSPHCHEEWDGTLTLRALPGRRPDRYDWALTWRVQEWPGGVPRSRARTTTATATLRAGDDAEAVRAATAGFDLCGGSQE